MDILNRRSQSYQWKIREIPWSSDALIGLSSEHGLFDNQEQSEEFLDLKEELKTHFWRVAKAGLTKRQFDVISLVAQGLTQHEIAKELGVNQSSVAKCLGGAKQKGLYEGKVFGGCIKKMKKLLDQDEEVQKILQLINDLLY